MRGGWQHRQDYWSEKDQYQEYWSKKDQYPAIDLHDRAFVYA